MDFFSAPPKKNTMQHHWYEQKVCVEKHSNMLQQRMKYTSMHKQIKNFFYYNTGYLFKYAVFSNTYNIKNC